MGMKTTRRGGENWVEKSSLKHYRGNAQEVLKMLKQDEETHPLKYVQVDKKTWIGKRKTIE
jgi:hypothetical protein